MASKTEQLLEAAKAPLFNVPNAKIERNTAVPEKIPAGRLIVLRDGDPGDLETALGGFPIRSGLAHWHSACDAITALGNRSKSIWIAGTMHLSIDALYSNKKELVPHSEREFPILNESSPF